MDEGTDMKVIVVVGGEEVNNVAALEVRDRRPILLSFQVKGVAARLLNHNRGSITY